MPLSAKHCIQGVKCSVAISNKLEPRPAPNQEFLAISAEPSQNPPRKEDRRPFTFHGERSERAMFDDDDYYMMGPIPSDLELQQKARSLGINPPTVELYSRHSKHFENLSATPSLVGFDKMPQSYAKFENGSSDTSSIMGGKSKPMSLPRIPVIRHSFKGSIPTVMRTDLTSTTLPECITALSPRTKCASVDISKLESRLLPPPKPSAAPSANVKRVGHRTDDSSKGLRIIVSPNSRADFKARPGDYYGRRYPLVIFDGKKGRSEDAQNNVTTTIQKPSLNGRHSLPAISTTNVDQSPSRARADAIPIEQVIEMSASRVKPLNVNISGWFPELKCKPKKLHSKSLDETRRRVVGPTSTAAK